MRTATVPVPDAEGRCRSEYSSVQLWLPKASALTPVGIVELQALVEAHMGRSRVGKVG